MFASREYRGDCRVRRVQDIIYSRGIVPGIPSDSLDWYSRRFCPRHHRPPRTIMESIVLLILSGPGIHVQTRDLRFKYAHRDLNGSEESTSHTHTHIALITIKRSSLFILRFAARTNLVKWEDCTESRENVFYFYKIFKFVNYPSCIPHFRAKSGILSLNLGKISRTAYRIEILGIRDTGSAN